jgi:uncharacterized SAM-binding protein YcdF (DUF218 family)
MFLFKKFLTAVILPPFSLILLAVAGLWVARRHPKSGRSISFIALTLMTALSLPPVAGTLVRSLEWYPPLPLEELSKTQAIVILSAGNYRDAPEYGGDTVSRFGLERIRYGVYLQRQTERPILVSGGTPSGGKPEAETMRDTIVNDFRGHVTWVENTSRDTAENALFSAAILRKAGISRITLVSQAWHLPRAVELFEYQGLEVLPAPTGFSSNMPATIIQYRPHADAMAESSRALQEWLGIVAQRLVGISGRFGNHPAG